MVWSAPFYRKHCGFGNYNDLINIIFFSYFHKTVLFEWIINKSSIKLIVTPPDNASIVHGFAIGVALLHHRVVWKCLVRSIRRRVDCVRRSSNTKYMLLLLHFTFKQNLMEIKLNEFQVVLFDVIINWNDRNDIANSAGHARRCGF